VPQAIDHFGEALATGDFNADGRADLAIGIPRKRINAVFESAGAAHVLYGGNGGLAATGDQHWHQGLPNVLGDLEPAEHFGAALD
jgi:FG-GAP repeat